MKLFNNISQLPEIVDQVASVVPADTSMSNGEIFGIIAFIVAMIPIAKILIEVGGIKKTVIRNEKDIQMLLQERSGNNDKDN